MHDLAPAYEAVKTQMRPMSATAPAAEVNAFHQKDGSAKENEWAKGSKGGKPKSFGSQDKYVIVANLYRPPKGNAKTFTKYLGEILDKINIGSKDIFIIGDFNIDSLDKKKQLNFF